MRTPRTTRPPAGRSPVAAGTSRALAAAGAVAVGLGPARSATAGGCPAAGGFESGG
ncbi:hypothetical protein ACFC1R_07620 [Kitasatospora sp. NPDC056138]|uniref:hypothetical protein n=1 Tax=Kitasatospora sp. NPDC056138 TaxID=3345724 RepID=UPI0035DB12E2